MHILSTCQLDVCSVIEEETTELENGMATKPRAMKKEEKKLAEIASGEPNEEPTRLNLALSRELASVVEELATSTDSTKTAVIRQAIALMNLAHSEKKKGRHLGFVDDSSRLDTEIVGAF